jgi:hypothetical protein
MRRMSPSLLRWLARWLLGAMLLATLAPAVSRTLTATRQAGDWVEICTTQGMRWAQWAGDSAEAGSGDLDEDLLHALDRCGLCALSAERFAPLLPSVPSVVVPDGDASIPPHTEVGAHALTALCPSARGPPLA